MHIAENSNRSTKPAATTGGDIDGQLSKYNTGQLTWHYYIPKISEH